MESKTKKPLGSVLKSLKGPVLITGHTGFKGTWLTLLLKKLDIPVVGISLPDDSYFLSSHLGSIADAEEFFDITDREKLEKFIKNQSPVAVFHLAAESIVSASNSRPYETFLANSFGTLNVLEACRTGNSTKSILSITTDKVYRNIDPSKRFIEEDSLEGSEIYSASKVAAEAIVQGWKKLSPQMRGGDGLLVSTARSGNVIGGGDFSTNRLLPDIIRSVFDSKSLTIRGLSSTRPWLHVLDSLKGYIQAIEYNIQNNQQENFNFGPIDRSLSVSEIIEICQEFFGHRILYDISKNKTEFEENISLSLDATKARESLNWMPIFSQYDAVLATCRWWQFSRTGDRNLKELCENEINLFINKKN